VGPHLAYGRPATATRSHRAGIARIKRSLPQAACAALSLVVNDVREVIQHADEPIGM